MVPQRPPFLSIVPIAVFRRLGADARPSGETTTRRPRATKRRPPLCNSHILRLAARKPEHARSRRHRRISPPQPRTRRRNRAPPRTTEPPARRKLRIPELPSCPDLPNLERAGQRDGSCMDARYPAKSRKNQSGILAETVGHAGGNGRVFRQRTDEPIRTRTALPQHADFRTAGHGPPGPHGLPLLPRGRAGRAHPQGVQPDTRVQERADAFHRTVARGPGINQPPACTHKEEL